MLAMPTHDVQCKARKNSLKRKTGSTDETRKIESHFCSRLAAFEAKTLPIVACRFLLLAPDAT